MGHYKNPFSLENGLNFYIHAINKDGRPAEERGACTRLFNKV
jgi:hypothetical protein